MKRWLLIACMCLNMPLFGANLAMDRDITTGILPNGMRYYIQENRTPAQTALFYLHVNSGSLDELQNERGLAHLIEHMAFNGSRDFSKNELIRKLEGFGVLFGADLNAYTTYESTVYNLKIKLDETNLNDTFRIFHNWIDGVSFDKEELDKERGVVMAEERTRNTPQYRLFKQEMKQYFGGSIYEHRAPIGDMNVIQNVSTEEIRALYKRIYQPRFMSFIAVGDFDKNEIEKRIQESFSKVSNSNSYTHPKSAIPLKNGLHIYNYNTNELGIDTAKIIFYDTFTPITTEESIRKKLLDMYISALINQIYTKKDGILKARFLAHPLQYRQMFYSFDINVINNDFKGSLSDLYGVIKGVESFGFNQTHFNNAKKTLINAIRTNYQQSSKRNSEYIAKKIIEHIDSGSTLQSPSAYKDVALKLLDEITPNEVYEHFKYIASLTSKSVSIYSQKGAILTDSEWTQIKNSAIALNTQEKEKSLPTALITHEITPKQIRHKTTDKEAQITTLELENGIKVIVKPLQTTPNLINFVALSSGGVSNIKNPHLGELGIALANQSGVGAFNLYEVGKITSGKSIHYSKFINNLSHGFHGKSSTEDIETLFEALHLEFTSPRFDAQKWEQIKTKMIEGLEKSKNLPEVKFEREYVNFLYDNHKRTKMLEANDVRATNMQQLQSVLKQKFSNPGDFTFVFVGDIDMQKIEALLRKYIATLPTSKQRDRFIDDGVRSIAGIHRFERHYHKTQKATISIVIKNEEVKYSEEKKEHIKAVAAILQQALREEIREDQGDTYGFSVRFRLKRYPYEHSVGVIAFECAPKRAEPIIRQVEEIIKRIQTNGGESRYLENYKKSSIITAQRALEDAKFWINTITAHVLYDAPIFNLRQYQALLDSLEAQHIIQGAMTWLKWQDVVISINFPQ